jgi:hypothetical protein
VVNRDIPESLVVVLGAGASYDCLPRGVTDSSLVTSVGAHLPGNLLLEDVRPPMTQQLASPRRLTNWALDRWEWARPVVSYLRRTLRESEGEGARSQALTLEMALGDYESSSGQVPDRKRHLLAMRFYLRDLFMACDEYVHSAELTGGDTNQVELIRLVADWCSKKNDRSATIVSFNYDLLAERALAAHWGFNPNRSGDYLSHPRIKLVKPHGSIAWYWRLSRSGSLVDFGRNPVEAGRISIEEALGFGVDYERMEYHDFSLAREVRNDLREPLIPAIALPVAGKADFVWPDSQRQHLDSLRGTVTRLLTIGWRGIEPHFVPLLVPLVKSYARIAVVAGGLHGQEEAGTTINTLKGDLTHIESKGWRPHGDGFTAFLDGSDDLDWFFG